MLYLRNSLHLVLMIGCAVICAASNFYVGGDEDWPEPEPPLIIDDTWVVENLFDGETGVSPHRHIRLTVGTQDLGTANASAVGRVLLYRQDDGASVSFEHAVSFESSKVWVPGGLEPDTDYVLDVQSLGSQLVSIRTLPSPIYFSTRSAPRVTGLWRNNDTLIVTFSEPMLPYTLFVGQTSVDVIWEAEGELHSIASDHNLAAYAWEPESLLFMMAPIDFADPLGVVWVKVAADVLAASGTSLDGDEDGIGGQPYDDYFIEVVTSTLPTCLTRSDIPAPCVHAHEVPDNQSWW